MRKITEEIDLKDIEMVTYRNAITAFAQSGQLNENDFLNVDQIDQSQKFEGNSILRGGQQPRIDKNSIIIK